MPTVRMTKIIEYFEDGVLKECRGIGKLVLLELLPFMFEVLIPDRAGPDS